LLRVGTDACCVAFSGVATAARRNMRPAPMWVAQREMHAEYGLTSIIATHNPRLAAACDRILRLELRQLRPA